METNSQSSVSRESQHLADRASVNSKPYGRASLFDGITFDAVEDYSRLQTQLERVRKFMSDGKWQTLAAIRLVAGGSDASISARLRDLRKEKHGSYNVERRRVKGGLWEYRINGFAPRTEKKKEKSITISELRSLALQQSHSLEEHLLFSRLVIAAEKINR